MPGRRVASIAEDPDLEVFQDFDVQDPEEAPLKRRPWAADEDEHLKMLVDEHGVKSWAHIATYLHMRNGKQCRERWRNHLRPQLNKGDWTAQEDCDIWDRVQEMGIVARRCLERRQDVCDVFLFFNLFLFLNN